MGTRNVILFQRKDKVKTWLSVSTKNEKFNWRLKSFNKEKGRKENSRETYFIDTSSQNSYK